RKLVRTRIVRCRLKIGKHNRRTTEAFRVRAIGLSKRPSSNDRTRAQGLKTIVLPRRRVFAPSSLRVRLKADPKQLRAETKTARRRRPTAMRTSLVRKRNRAVETDQRSSLKRTKKIRTRTKTRISRRS